MSGWLWSAEETPTTFPKTPATRIGDPVSEQISLSPSRPVSELGLACPHDALKWQLEYPAQSTEAFTFYFSLDSGVYVLAQLVYSTLGLGPSVQMVLRIYNPDKSKFSRTLSPAVASFVLSDDNRSVVCEEFSFISDNNGGFKINIDIGSEAALDLVFEPLAGSAFKVNDGKVLFNETEDQGFVEAQFIPKAKVHGNITFDGKKSDVQGSGMFLHAIQCCPQYVSRWNFVNFQNANDSIFLYEFDMPKESEYAVKSASTGAIVRNGKRIAVTTANRTVHVQTELDESFSGYEVPTQLFIVWTGKTEETGEDIRVEISLVQKNLLDRIDVLGELPFLLKMLIQTFITAPFVYQWYEDVTAKVTIGSEKFELEGKAFIECVFLMTEY
ncbi:putative cell survival pathways protein [Physocladia obscura]|uniref:Cell survival pathways protein n=1 Tax=Physocladia obscura TaxID=109957 RepID=A0AAD5T0G3_9FUNG|nr:putative cell survival pathways protein [Physocladia obscura]